jgi:periplasmic protein TonB
MRVLVVDQDSTSNLAIARSLRDRYTVDAVGSKADCLDLLRSNTFEVIVACERLEDGSGLELLGQIAKRWPRVLRLFAADRQRLKLLKGRLGPFELFQTLSYPIDPEKLAAILAIAANGTGSDAAARGAQRNDEAAETDEDRPGESESPELETAEAEPFPAPQPEPRSLPPGVRVVPRKATRARARSPGPRERPNGSHTRSARAHSHAAPETEDKGGRGRPANVRFPPRVTGESASSTPQYLGSGSLRRKPDEATGVVALGRLAAAAPPVTTLRPVVTQEDSESRRVALLVGGGVAAAVAAILIGFRIFSPHQPPQVHAVQPAQSNPEYPLEVTALVNEIEAALQRDDFAVVRADLPRLQTLAPLHPRLAFFQDLLARHPSTAQPATPADTRRTARNGAAPARSASAPPPPAAAAAGQAAKPAVAPVANSGFAPETPVGFSMAHAEATEPKAATATAEIAATTAPPPAQKSVSAQSAAQEAVASAAEVPAAPAATASAAEAVPAHQSVAPAVHKRGSEPPPVVREARLIRSVKPDYPSAARREGVVGSVDMQITVSQSGAVTDVAVIQADPPGMFEKSAVSAVRKWKYEPQYVDGLPADAHLSVHLDFNPG